MTIGILKEPLSETRVSMLPDIAAAFLKQGIDVLIETGAGNNAYASDETYSAKGIKIESRNNILQQADIILSMHTLTDEDVTLLKKDAILIGVFQPLFNAVQMKGWASKNITTFSLDMIPRTTRAQSMDVLSSQANIAGYKAVFPLETPGVIKEKLIETYYGESLFPSEDFHARRGARPKVESFGLLGASFFDVFEEFI